MAKGYTDFTDGAIFIPLVKFAVPLFWAIFLQSMYSAIDILILGHFTDAVNVSAVSTGSFLMMTITFVIVGISTGMTIILGHKIGQKKLNEAGDVIGAGLVLFFILAIIVTVAMQLLAKPITLLLQVPPQARQACIQYIKVCCAGAIFICGYNIIGSVFRGIGDSKTPLIAVAIASVLNVFGDLLFVVVIPMGAVGVALATVAAQAFSVVICIFIIRIRRLPFSFGIKNIKFDGHIISRILNLGIPIAFQDLLVSISFLVLTAIINRLGVIASAGIGVAERVCGFIMIVPSAYMQSVSSFVAQNVAAYKYSRAEKALFYGIATSLCVGIMIGLFSFIRGDLLAAVFSNNSEVISVAHQYLKAYAIDCVFVSFLFCFCGYFNGCGKTRFNMLQAVTGAFCIRIPIAYLMSNVEPVSVFYIGLATPVSTVVQILICTIYFIILRRHQISMNPKI